MRKQVSLLTTEKLSAAEVHAQHLTQMRESADGFLAAQLATEEKLFAAEEENQSLQEQLAESQASLAAHMEAERLAEEAKERAERESEDLHNQLAFKDVILGALKAGLEVQAVDRFKRSLAYDALLLREFERGMRQSRSSSR